MEFFKWTFFIFLFSLLNFKNYGACVEIPKHILPQTCPEVQESAIRDLIERAVGKDGAKHFIVMIDKNMEFRSFHIKKTDDNRLLIIGSDGISIAKAFHHYLKYYLNVDLTWIKPYAELPTSIQFPNISLSSTSASPFIYYQNVCTWSYSFAWWDWAKDWRRHIDWMAMMGITLTIAPIQEQIWYELFLRMGLTEEEIDEHFAGPAFQAWQRMGNIRGWAGPLPKNYRKKQIFLQQQILKAQRDIGMSVALPAFAGHLPVAMKRLYPNVRFTYVQRWNRFPDPYCCSLFLDPNEELFHSIAGEFLRRINEVYGSNHIYFADPFNEIQPRLADINYLNMTAFHIYDSMRAIDSSAIWLLQGWMFVKNEFWSDELVKSFLTAVPYGKLLVLDLQSEQYPQYERTHSYYGQPFIWCMLHNFGGTLGMHGSPEIVNTRIRIAREITNSTMIGVGITPEGIYQNYVMYSFAMERAWTIDDFDLNQWFTQHSDITYGVKDDNLRKAWHLLYRSVYSYSGIISLHGRYPIARRPGLNLDPWIWYNFSDIEQAWLSLLNDNQSASTANYDAYSHDLVDVTRQYLQINFDQLYVNLISAFRKQKLDRFKFISKQMHTLFNDLEEILATNVNFLLGKWIKSAKSLAETLPESSLFELNARNQITAWGPTGQILDYATKQWSGIIKDYYHPRWALFLDTLEKCLRENKRFNNYEFKQIVSNEIEYPFSIQTKQYPVKGIGDTLNVSRRIYNRWMQNHRNSTYLHFCRLRVKIK